MSNIIIGTAGHIDHGKTALIKALNGYEGDETSEEKKRGITIDLSFSNLKKGDKNIAFIDVPGHEKLVKNMISGAFGFDYVMLVVSAAEGIMPQTIEHIEIINLLDIKNLILVITKKDLVTKEELELQKEKTLEFLNDFNFNITFTQEVSIYDENSIKLLTKKLLEINTNTKIKENFFRYYIDRIFSPKGIGTVVTGTVLGNEINLGEKVFIYRIKKESKIKTIQIHNLNTEKADISNRAALNLQGINANQLKKGDLISKKGYLRGFNTIDISFNCLKGKKLQHDTQYSLFIGSLKTEVKVLLFNNTDSLDKGFATLKCDEQLFTIFKEKFILRNGNQTICGGKILNPIADPMKKSQKTKILNFLEKDNFMETYKILLTAHKKGLGIISSTQRFALNHNQALELANKLENVFIDEKDLVIYPLSAKNYIIDFVKKIYTKNPYALLSSASINLRLTWASLFFIENALEDLVRENFLKKENNLYLSANVKNDFKKDLENIVLDIFKKEDICPRAPYNIYDELDLDRKLGDDILKILTKKKEVIRLQHNLFIHSESLSKIVQNMKEIIKNEGYINISNFKDKFPLTRKYLICYLDYLDNFPEIKKSENKRIFA